MFQSQDQQFNQVKDFHLLMDGTTQERVQPFEKEVAVHRAAFKLEEIIEFLHASATTDEEFSQFVQSMHQAIDQAVDKVSQKGYPKSSLVGQVDALMDLLYFTYGSFVLMGVDPQPIFEIVHRANMGKRFPDGQAHFDPITHKILKPEHWEEEFAPEERIRKELTRQEKRE